MIFGSSNVLGIALSDRTIACAQIAGKGDGELEKTATFTLPSEAAFDKPEAVGVALAAFLKKEGFTASHVVVGVPAKWLITAEKDIPPASRDQMRSMLRLQAERLPLAESGDVVFDYAGQYQANKPARVMLVAMLKKQLERIEQAIQAAGLNLVAVTPTALALANSATLSSKVNNNLPMVIFGRGGAEVVWQRQGIPRMLRHFSLPISNGAAGVSLGTLGTELRRAVTLGSGQTNGESTNGTDEMVLWDGVGLEDSQVAELSEKVGLKVRSGDNLAMLGVKVPLRRGSGEQDSVQHYAAAVSLALAGANRKLLPLNFAKSRLAPPPVRHVGRRGAWAIVAGSLILIGIIALYISVKLREGDLADLLDQRASINKPFLEAQSVKDKVDFSSGFLSKRTPTLDCLMELTLSVRDDDPMWATSFQIQELKDSKDPGMVEGSLVGRTTDTSVPNRLINRLQQNPKFSNVKLTSLTGGSGRGRGESLANFTIGFTFNPKPSPTGASK